MPIRTNFAYGGNLCCSQCRQSLSEEEADAIISAGEPDDPALDIESSDAEHELANSFTPGPWYVFHDESGMLVRADCGDNIARVCDYGPLSETPDAAKHNAQLLATSPRLANALWGLLVALGKHATDFTPAQLADICPACDEASAVLIESGKVLG